MRLQQDLQVALRDRYRRCLIQSFETLAHETRMTRDWIIKQPALKALLEVAAQVEPELDVAKWPATLGQYGSFNWPCATEAGRATLAWAVMNAVADDPYPDRVSLTYGHNLSSSTHLQDMARDLVDRIYQPLFDYLIDYVGQDSSALYLLDRFARKVEWFTREDLYKAYQENTARGEDVYDRALREFLFSEGVNMPYSQTKSASGVSDILTDLESEETMLCEVKLFIDDKRPIASGLHQSVLYAQDHGKTTAYLVIMNLSGRPIHLPTDGDAKQNPPYLEVSGVRVYLIPIRALPPARSASKAGKADPVTFTRDHLLEAD